MLNYFNLCADVRRGNIAVETTYAVPRTLCGNSGISGEYIYI